ncbi:hypothetical protein JKP88DRAFT_304958 [Tribonema minus]|uniref:WW domain-containing protein n=1 Tax=Tribonema minus TaxID=303371 RepID=A0A835Z7V0_9STRA|nr:hypothetical protein JKP88DRAFT_304958 [Tribonema minus]
MREMADSDEAWRVRPHNVTPTSTEYTPPPRSRRQAFSSDRASFSLPWATNSADKMALAREDDDATMLNDDNSSAGPTPERWTPRVVTPPSAITYSREEQQYPDHGHNSLARSTKRLERFRYLHGPRTANNGGSYDVLTAAAEGSAQRQPAQALQFLDMDDDISIRGTPHADIQAAQLSLVTVVSPATSVAPDSPGGAGDGHGTEAVAPTVLAAPDATGNASDPSVEKQPSNRHEDRAHAVAAASTPRCVAHPSTGATAAAAAAAVTPAASAQRGDSAAAAHPDDALVAALAQLGDEWREARAPDSRPYYYCRRTRETRWRLPAGAVTVDVGRGADGRALTRTFVPAPRHSGAAAAAPPASVSAAAVEAFTAALVKSEADGTDDRMQRAAAAAPAHGAAADGAPARGGDSPHAAPLARQQVTARSAPAAAAARSAGGSAAAAATPSLAERAAAMRTPRRSGVAQLMHVASASAVAAAAATVAAAVAAPLGEAVTAAVAAAAAAHAAAAEDAATTVLLEGAGHDDSFASDAHAFHASYLVEDATSRPHVIPATPEAEACCDGSSDAGDGGECKCAGSGGECAGSGGECAGSGGGELLYPQALGTPPRTRFAAHVSADKDKQSAAANTSAASTVSHRNSDAHTTAASAASAPPAAPPTSAAAAAAAPPPPAAPRTSVAAAPEPPPSAVRHGPRRQLFSEGAPAQPSVYCPYCGEREDAAALAAHLAACVVLERARGGPAQRSVEAALLAARDAADAAAAATAAAEAEAAAAAPRERFVRSGGGARSGEEQCADCGRTFAEGRIDAHARVCRRVFGARRPVFDGRERRLRGTPLAFMQRAEATGGVGGSGGKRAATAPLRLATPALPSRHEGRDALHSAPSDAHATTAHYGGGLSFTSADVTMHRAPVVTPGSDASVEKAAAAGAVAEEATAEVVQHAKTHSKEQASEVPAAASSAPKTAAAAAAAALVCPQCGSDGCATRDALLQHLRVCLLDADETSAAAPPQSTGSSTQAEGFAAAAAAAARAPPSIASTITTAGSGGAAGAGGGSGSGGEPRSCTFCSRLFRRDAISRHLLRCSALQESRRRREAVGSGGGGGAAAARAERVRCPHCLRGFSAAAAPHHIAICERVVSRPRGILSGSGAV